MPRLLTLAAAQTGSVAEGDLRTITESQTASSASAIRSSSRKAVKTQKFPWWRDRRPDLYRLLVE